LAITGQTPQKRQKLSSLDGESPKKELKFANVASLPSEHAASGKAGDAKSRCNYAVTLKSLARKLDDVRTSVTMQKDSSEQKTKEALKKKFREQDVIIGELESKCKDLESQLALAEGGGALEIFRGRLMQLSASQAARMNDFQNHLRACGQEQIATEAWHMFEQEREIEMTAMIDSMHKMAVREEVVHEKMQHATHATLSAASELARWSKAAMGKMTVDLNKFYETFNGEVSSNILKNKNEIITLVAEFESQASRIEKRLHQAGDVLKSLTQQQEGVSDAVQKHRRLSEKTKATVDDLWKGARKSYLGLVLDEEKQRA
jgi:hypothetical protein